MCLVFSNIKATNKMDREIVMIRKYWEMTLVTTTEKSEADIKELFICKKHLTIMDIIGEGTLSAS